MSTLKADTIVASDGTSPATLTKQSAAKAFISYNPEDSSNPVDLSFNFSTLADNGDGDVTFNWTSSFSGGTYPFQVTATDIDSGSAGYGYGYISKGTDTRTIGTASSHRVTTGYVASSTFQNLGMYCYTAHGDLA